MPDKANDVMNRLIRAAAGMEPPQQTDNEAPAPAAVPGAARAGCGGVEGLPRQDHGNGFMNWAIRLLAAGG